MFLSLCESQCFIQACLSYNNIEKYAEQKILNQVLL